MEPTPDSIPANAGGDGGYTMEDLKKSIANDDELYAVVKKRINLYRVVQHRILHIAKAFIDTLSVDEIGALFNSSNDEIANDLFNRHKTFVPPECPDFCKFDDSLTSSVENWAFQVCAAAFMNSNKCNKRPFPAIHFHDRDLGDISYQIEIKLAKCLREESERKHREWVQRRKIWLASKDVDKEHDADLPPADKMRIFRNALRSRDDIGGDYWDGTYWKETFITITNTGLKNVQMLFNFNPECSPAELLTVMDGCIELFMSQQPPEESEHDDKWHARRGCNLDFFVKNIPAICEQLDIICPIENDIVEPG